MRSRWLVALALVLPVTAGVVPAAAEEVDPQTESRVARAIDGLGKKLYKAFKGMKGNVKYQWLAVNPFVEKGPQAEERELGAVVTARLVTYLRRDKKLDIVERDRLADAIEELALAQTGLVENDGDAAKAGQMAGADAIVVGSVADAGDTFLVNARIISVANATVLVADSAEIQAADLIALSAEAVVLKSKSGALFRALTPFACWGQWYNDDLAKAIVFMSGQVLAAAATAVFWTRGYMAQKKYEWSAPGINIPRGESGYRADYDTACNGTNCPENWGPSDQGEGPACQQGSGSGENGECTVRDWLKHREGAHTVLREEAEQEYLIGNIMIGVWAGVFLISILDAYLSGTDYDYGDAVAARPGGRLIPWVTRGVNGARQAGLSWSLRF